MTHTVKWAAAAAVIVLLLPGSFARANGFFVPVVPHRPVFSTVFIKQPVFFPHTFFIQPTPVVFVPRQQVIPVFPRHVFAPAPFPAVFVNNGVIVPGAFGGMGGPFFTMPQSFFFR